MINRVRAGALYTFQPVPLDQWMPLYGVLKGMLEPGCIVRAVYPPGCPPTHTIGHAYIEDPESRNYLGLVHCNSLRTMDEGGRH
jgi:hypothetical protein